MLQVIPDEEWRNIYISDFKILCRFMDENDIRYSLAFGSLLGCVREKQMIKWDYDIDVFIDLENVKKLYSVKHKLPDNFSFVENVSDGVGLHRIIIKDLYEIYNETLFRCFFDLFEYMPIDGNDFDNIRKIVGSRITVNNRINTQCIRSKPLSIIKKIFCLYKYGNDAKAYIGKRLKKYENKNGDSIFVLFKSLKFDRPKKTIKSIFEGVNVEIFDNYDEFLKEYFGEDYMIPKKLKIYDNKNFIFLKKVNE